MQLFNATSSQAPSSFTKVLNDTVFFTYLISTQCQLSQTVTPHWISRLLFSMLFYLYLVVLYTKY